MKAFFRPYLLTGIFIFFMGEFIPISSMGAEASIYCAQPTAVSSCTDYSGAWNDDFSNTLLIGVAQSKCDNIIALYIDKIVESKVDMKLNGTPVLIKENDNSLNYYYACLKDDLYIERIFDSNKHHLYQLNGTQLCQRQFINGRDTFLGCKSIHR